MTGKLYNIMYETINAHATNVIQITAKARARASILLNGLRFISPRTRVFLIPYQNILILRCRLAVYL